LFQAYFHHFYAREHVVLSAY